MERRYPYYYKYFKCKAGECTDSCCMHWQIDIDEKSLEKYENWTGDFGDRLRDSIWKDAEGGHFKMDSRERCVFLRDDGLCDMILNIGEEHLCNICTEHPRFYDSFSNGEEVGAGLCCEAAAKLILDSSISDEIVSEGTFEGKLTPDEELLFAEREELLKHTEMFEPLWTDMDSDDYYQEWADAFYSHGTIDALIELLLSLEIVSPKWKEMLLDLKEKSDEVIESRDSFMKAYPAAASDYHRLLRYFIYRYYMTARFDDDVELAAEERLQFVMLSVGIIILMDVLRWYETGSFTEEDQIDICKLYSQEIEYDLDNVYELENFWFT